MGAFSVGQSLPLSIQFLDQNGHEMAVTPTPDAPPAWTNGNPAVDTLTVSADGLSASDLGVSAGADTIGVSLSVGGVSFAASDAVTVTAAPQTLTSIAIVEGTPS